MPITHATPADGTFSAAGAAAWNQDHTLPTPAEIGALTQAVADALYSALGHLHDIAQVNGLQAALDALNVALAGKASTVHAHSATDITSGTLPIARGGTNKSAWTANQIVYADGAGALTQSASFTLSGTTLTIPVSVQSATSLLFTAQSGALQFFSSGATASVELRSLDSAVNDTGNINIATGVASGAANNAGTLTVQCGNTVGATAGSMIFTAGSATGAAGTGGVVFFQAGGAVTAGSEGGIYFADSLFNFTLQLQTIGGVQGIGMFNQPPAPQPTYGAVSGAISRGALNTGTVTLAGLAQIVGALLTDLKTRGDIA